MEEKHRLMYGSYREEEIDKIAEVFRKAGAAYETDRFLTARKHDRFVIDGMVTKTQEVMIRSEVRKMAERNSNWGKIGYVPTVEKKGVTRW